MHLRGYPRRLAGHRRLTLAAAAALALAAGALPALTGAAPAVAAQAAQTMTTGPCPATPAGDTMASLDQLRTGWDNCEPANLMGPSAVPKFTQRWKTLLGGQVYAQPLVIGNIVFVATENDWIYGLNRLTGARIWQKHLGNAFVIGNAPDAKLRKCHDLIPNIGVTGTPAMDPATGNVAFFAKVMSGKYPQYYLYEMNPSNGSIVRKVQIGGHPSNAPKLTFNAQMELERPGVLISGGAAYAAFSAHCDTTPYSGYVARVNLSTGQRSLWTDESGTTYNRAGIWDSGGGLMTDPNNPGAGIFTTSGNGVSPAPGPGSRPPGQLAESVISLKTNSNGTVAAQDFFSPRAAPSWDAADTDFGSGGPVGLPYGTSSYPHVLVQAGKSGQLFVLNENSLGGRDQGARGGDNAVFYTKAYGGSWGHPAVFEDGSTISAGTNSTANNYLFYVGRQDTLRVFRIMAGKSNQPVISMVGNSSLVYPYTSGSPVVTSYGSNPTTAVVWVVRTGGATGSGGELDAYSLGSLINSSGKPSACSSSKPCMLKPIWHSPGFIATKFAIPATSNGWVYVGTRNHNSKGALTANGYVIGYALRGTNAPVKPAAAATVTPAGLNGTSTAAPTTASPVSITASKAMTVTGAATSAGASNAATTRNAFSVGHVYLQRGSGARQLVRFPVKLAPGDKLTAYVRFSPVAPGLNNGTLTFRTAARGFTVPVPLSGNGVQNGITAQETSLPFQLAPDQNIFTVPVGIALPQTVDFTNFGTQPVKVTSVTAPAGEFTAAGLPSVGQTINPGETVSVQVTFAPTHAGPASSSVTVAGSSGPAATVTLTGTAVPAVSRLSPSGRTVSFGTVRVGKRASRSIHITNTGNQPSEITTTSPLARPFAAVLTPPDLMPLNPTYDMAVPVTFTPTKKGNFTTHYTLHWTDGTGSHSLTVTLTGKAV